MSRRRDDSPRDCANSQGGTSFAHFGGAMNWANTQGIERRLLLWAAVTTLAGAGSCGSKPLQPDGGPGAGGSSVGGSRAGGTSGSGGVGGGGAAGDGGACTPSDGTVFCLPGSGATVDTCGDLLTPASCVGGQWVCSPGTGVPTRCRCPGLNTLMCVCTSDGWQCETGGTGGGAGTGGRGGNAGAGGASGSSGSGGTGGGCGLPQQGCAVSSGGICSDALTPATCQAGAWVCPPGTVNATTCVCTGAPRPGCFCTTTGWRCGSGGNQGHGGTGGQGGGAGAGGGTGGGSGGAAGGNAGAGGSTGGAGGNSAACSAVATLDACEARSDCHSVFTDPHNCACAALGCCARFSRCADGKARCTSGIGCEMLTPYCESPYVVSYTPTCYEGCVRATACTQ
jgi:hypothetical protein